MSTALVDDLFAHLVAQSQIWSMSTCELHLGEDSGFIRFNHVWGAKLFRDQSTRDSAHACQHQASMSNLAPIAPYAFETDRCGDLRYAYLTGVAAPLGPEHTQEDTVKVIAGLIRAGIQPIDLMPWQTHNYGCDPKDRSKVWAVDFSRCRMADAKS